MSKYTLDKWKQGKFTYYTIWEEESQDPVFDFSTQDYGRSTKKTAMAKLKELNDAKSGKAEVEDGK